MTKKNRPSSPDEHVDRLLEELNLTEKQREFISSWRKGGLIDDTANSREAQQVALDLMRLACAIPNDDDKFDPWALERLADAELDWRLAFNETVLHWLAKDPTVAVRKIEQKHAEQSRTNSDNAQHSREGALDWWARHIQDCLESNFCADPDEVIDYLLATEEVEWDGKLLRHIRNAADPITRRQVRSRMNSAKKRILRES